MDEQLAQIYGTGQPVAYDEEDLQKTAAAELLVKLAAEQGVDLGQFSDEEVAGMIHELYKEAQDAPPFPPKKKEEGKEHEAKESAEMEEGEDEEEEEAKEKEAQEKFAEADFLGRVMAHAMVQELNNIDKAAAAQPAPEQSKEASALEQMAQQRAWEMAKEAGYVDAQGNLLIPQAQPEQEKTSSLKQAVDFRALQLLEEVGLPVEWKKE
jgi:hypothetical protein